MSAPLEEEGKQIVREIGLMGIIICLKFILTVALICAGLNLFI